MGAFPATLRQGTKEIAMRLLVAVKRVIDYNARVRVKPDNVSLF